ncbi:hemagglutinin repeat-containing protein, partial [Cetobacterium sp.]
KGVTIKTDNLISESLRNGAYASIEGENITIVSKNDIVNKGGSIIADENIILNTENGNIVNDTKVHINDNTYKDTVTDIVGKGVISGENIIIDSGKDFSNAGGEVLAKDTVNIKASENINLDSVETVTQKQTGSSKNYTINRKEENIGSNISGENINLEAGKNLTAIGSDVVANKDLNVKAGENINIVGSVDSESTEKHKSSSGFFKSKESIDIKYDETINVSNFISGNNMNVEAGNNINVVVSNVVSDKELNLEAGNNVVISSGLEGSSEHHESIKTGFLGLSGRYEKDKEINYKNVGSYVGATEDINIKANNNVNVIASDVESGKDINISAGKDVNIVAGDDITKKESEKHKTKTSIFGSVKDLNFEVGLKTEASKNQSTSLDTKVTGSNILVGGD